MRLRTATVVLCAVFVAACTSTQTSLPRVTAAADAAQNGPPGAGLLTPGEYGGTTCFAGLPGCPSPALACVTQAQADDPSLLIPPPNSGCTRELTWSGTTASWTDTCPGNMTVTGSLTVAKNEYSTEMNAGPLTSFSSQFGFAAPNCNPHFLKAP